MASVFSIQHLTKFNIPIFRCLTGSCFNRIHRNYCHGNCFNKRNLCCGIMCTYTTRSTTNLRSSLWRRYCEESNMLVSRNKLRHSSAVTINSQITVGDLVDENVKCLLQASVPEPKESVELFVAHVLGRSTLHGVSPNKCLSLCEAERVKEMVKTRLNRVPIQYILGEWDFCDLTLKMKPPVFIPRPETEELVGYIMTYLQEMKLFNIRMLEVGCGTGAITLAVLKEYPEVQAICIDKTTAACDLTQDNARRTGLTDRVEVLHRDITQDVSDLGLFDLIVSNPPYISTDDMVNLDPQVIRYEDRTALDGGTDGLDVVRQLLSKASSLLNRSGTVWLEVDTVHPAVIEELVAQGHYPGLHYTRTIQDFTLRPRFCVLQRPP